MTTNLQAIARLATASKAAQADLDALLDGWFKTHFVKKITLQTARSLHATGALASFNQVLGAQDEQTVLAVLRKLDPNNVGILSQPRAAMVRHIGALAGGKLEPVGKPRAKRAASKPAPRARKSGGVLANARQG